MKEKGTRSASSAPRTKLKHIQIKNYRSLEGCDIPLDDLTAIVGANGVGKTSLLRGLDLILGDSWPSLRSFRIPQDFTSFDASREIEFYVKFGPAYIHRDTLSTEHEVHALRLTCKPYRKSGRWGEAGDLHVDLEPLNDQGEVPIVATSRPQKGQKPLFGPLRVGTELREHARILFIDHRRGLAQHMPYSRGSILGKLFQTARKEFDAEAEFKTAYDAAMEILRTERIKEIETTVSETAKRMLGFLGSAGSKNIDIGFGFADPANPFNSLRLQYSDSGLTIPGEELGLGIQSAMVVGVFEAFRKIGGKIGTVVIEEPEMYLHPQAQRYFYNLLCAMTDDGQCQVVYSTHSPVFADVNRFESLRLLRKQTSNKSEFSYLRPEKLRELETARAGYKLGGRFDSSRNEVLFSSAALLVEGYGDRVAAFIAADKLGIDIDAEGISIVDCGGKTGIELVARVCIGLGIPTVILHDEDIYSIDGIEDLEKKRKQEKLNEDEIKANKKIMTAIDKPEYLFILKPSLETVLGIGRDARDKPKRIAEALEHLDLTRVPDNLAPLISAVRSVADATHK